MSVQTGREPTRRYFRARLSALGAGLSVVALIAGAVPAVALPGDPIVTYIDWGATTPQAVLSTSSLDGTGTSVLTPSGLNTQSFSVSDDGNTIAMSGWTGGYSDHDRDVTYGTVVTHRVGSVSETRILSSNYVANPVVSGDGEHVWFLNQVYNSTKGTYSLALYRYDTTEKITTKLNLAADFQPTSATGPYPVRLAISPDGTMAAMAYLNFNVNDDVVNPSRIFAAGITTGKLGNYFEKKEAVGSASLLSWISLEWGDDNSTLSFSELPAIGGNTANYSVAVTSPNSQALTGPLAEWYDVTRYGGEWWMWKDITSSSTVFGHSSDPSPTVEPATTTSWGGPFNVGKFRLSSITPPAIGSPVNKPGAHADLVLYSTHVGYKKSTPYATFNEYLVPLPGLVFANDYNETERGILESSLDGHTYRTVLTTTGAHLISAGGYLWNGNLPAVTRNLYYRWHFLGTTLAAAGYSPVSKVIMIPTVTAVVRKSGSRRIIYGTATRLGGTVALYRIVGSSATKLLTRSINSHGQYSLGTIYLRAGNYRISTVADAYAGSGFKLFRV